MAWTTPKTTWKTAELVNAAADMNVYLRDNLLRVGSHLTFSTWLPTVGVVGSSAPSLGGLPTQVGRFIRLGTTVNGTVHGSCAIGFSSDMDNGAGTYLIKMPLYASSSDAARQRVVGSGAIYDGSAGTVKPVLLVAYSSAWASLRYTCTGAAETAVTHAVPWTWSSGDQMHLEYHYEVR